MHQFIEFTMTNLEALTAVVNIPGIPATTLEKACIDRGITAGSVYNTTIKKLVDLAAVDVLRGVVVEGESEGGFRYNISIESLRARIDQLLSLHGESSVSTPTVRGVNRW